MTKTYDDVVKLLTSVGKFHISLGLERISKILEILDEKGQNLEVANTNTEVYLKLDNEPVDYEVALGRTVGVKENVS